MLWKVSIHATWEFFFSSLAFLAMLKTGKKKEMKKRKGKKSSVKLDLNH